MKHRVGLHRDPLRAALVKNLFSESLSEDGEADKDCGLSLLLDDAGRARWRECDLPDSHEFYDNVLTWEWGQRYGNRMEMFRQEDVS